MANEAATPVEEVFQLPVRSHRPDPDPEVERLWNNIERAYRTASEHNAETLRQNVGAATAAAVTFGSQLFNLGFVSPGADVDNSQQEASEHDHDVSENHDDDSEEHPPENPT
jgi:hypothetical protein